MSAMTLPVPAAITASGDSGACTPNSDTATVVITVPVTAMSGFTAPKITFSAQRSAVGADWPVTDWDAGSTVTAAQLSAPGTAVLTLPPLLAPDGTASQWYRVLWTVTGTSPSILTATATEQEH